MDPISLIEAALVTGAAASAKDTSQATKDAYSSLITRLRYLLTNKTKALVTLDDHATDPETYERPLKKVLAEAHVDQDNELLIAAQQVIASKQPQQIEMGKYTIQNTGPVQGQIIGEGNQISQHFGDLPQA